MLFCGQTCEPNEVDVGQVLAVVLLMDGVDVVEGLEVGVVVVVDRPGQSLVLK